MKVASTILLAALPVSALALDMTDDQYIEYMALQHCANQQHWEQPDKLNAELAALDQRFNIGDDDFEALDDKAMAFADQPDGQEKLEQRVKSLCP